MEGSESEAVFDGLNLNPQLFCNEVLNNVDDMLDEAFDFFYQDASTKLNIEDTQRSQDLKKGVDCIRQSVQSVLDKQLAAWENYILRHCFALPRGFRMPNTDESNENGLDLGALFDPDIDAQLDSLREKLAEVGKESEMLNQEIQALERKSTGNAGYINEAVQLCEQNSMHELFQEMVTTASELGMKMGKLNSNKIEETEQMKTKRIYSTEMDLSAINPAKGLSKVKLDDLEEFASVMKIPLAVGCCAISTLVNQQNELQSIRLIHKTLKLASQQLSHAMTRENSSSTCCNSHFMT
ncbi:Protein MIS12-like protein [Mucuna pruriens]|uniref:Protein MIS12-like protein n=1 Tax=Mucuna pruriens TaxID=157652 RepID=A0A371I568_MUCPR|nr:Protein MIS12-like protein [Mucuna pruriens]